MQQSDTVQELLKALTSAKQSFGKIEKTSKNEFKNYGYANLGELFTKTQRALHDNGLHIVQCLEKELDSYVVSTTLFHVSGEYLTFSAHLPSFQTPSKGNSYIQEVGTLTTYIKRYQYAAILGLDADFDDDGERAGTYQGDSAKKGLTPAQRKYLLDMMEKAAMTEEEFLAMGKISSLDELAGEQLEKAVRYLKAKATKEEANHA